MCTFIQYIKKKTDNLELPWTLKKIQNRNSSKMWKKDVLCTIKKLKLVNTLHDILYFDLKSTFLYDDKPTCFLRYFFFTVLFVNRGMCSKFFFPAVILTVRVV